jgi:MoxR-like ATPase
MRALSEQEEPPRLQPRLAAAADPVDDAGATIDDVARLGVHLRAGVERSMHMSADTLDVVLATLIAGGHLLVEDHPGVGKTRLANTLARSLDGRFARVQATVDLLPGDIVGTSVWRPESAGFEFLPGPVFANVLMVDELNRATPKTQSGLLEAMQERQVTVDGRTRPVPRPFTVIATQNPGAGHDGTYPLPPAQLDRFMARISLGYPTADQELALLRDAGEPALAPVTSTAQLLAAQEAAAGVHASEALLRYVVEVLDATRRHPLAEVGASPRAGVLLLAAARARAALDGRDHALPDDVQSLASAVLTHRVEAAAAAPPDAAEGIVSDAIARVRAR